MAETEYQAQGKNMENDENQYDESERKAEIENTISQSLQESLDEIKEKYNIDADMNILEIIKENNQSIIEREVQWKRDDIVKNLAVEKLEDIEREMYLWQGDYNRLVDIINALVNEDVKKSATDLAATIEDHEKFRREAELKCLQYENEVEMKRKRNVQSQQMLQQAEAEFKALELQVIKEQSKVEKVRQKLKLKLEEKQKAEEVQKANLELQKKLAETTLKSQELAKISWQREISIRDAKSKIKAMEAELLQNNAKSDELEAKTKDFKLQSVENQKKLRDVISKKLQGECVMVDQQTQKIAKSLAQILEKREDSIAKKSESIKRQESLQMEIEEITKQSEQLKNKLKMVDLKLTENKETHKKRKNQLKQELNKLKKQNNKLNDQKRAVEFDMQASKCKYEDMMAREQVELDYFTENQETADSSFDLSFGSSLTKLEKVKIISPTQFLKNSISFRSFTDDNHDDTTSSSS